ncbi:hypothetical protein FJT64_007131 [Amphibalanus amphitrite]|uniref:Protein capicua homolog-like domain-containing protein n=1 Tax=Amphibalanus amphitrite TaxID=1232801 RepID=A0A6A4VWZ0_AMPAM|nr:hypothetical protein FJT64_007131 [Amphibalanus amphitrite]
MPKQKKRASASPKARGKRRLEEPSAAPSSVSADTEPDSKRTGKLAKVMGREPAPSTSSGGGAAAAPQPALPPNECGGSGSVDGSANGGRVTPAGSGAPPAPAPAPAAPVPTESSQPVHDVRKLPKKRKFNPAELEGMQQDGAATERPAAWERPPLTASQATSPPPRPAAVTVYAQSAPPLSLVTHVPVSRTSPLPTGAPLIATAQASHSPPPPPLTTSSCVLVSKGREPAEGAGRPPAAHLPAVDSEPSGYRGEDLRPGARRAAELQLSPLLPPAPLLPVQIHIPDQPPYGLRMERPAARPAEEQRRLDETRRILEISRGIAVRAAEPRRPQTVPLPLLNSSHEPKLVRDARDLKPSMFSPGESRPARPMPTLAEWRGHRVLAKRETYYLPGVIKGVYRTCDVSVLFDGHQQPFIYSNVSEPGRCDVISDAAPLSSQVSSGLRVAVRVDADKMVFVEGTVVAANRPAHLFKIKVLSQEGPLERWYARPAVRLLQPPWFEELDEPAPLGGPPATQVTPPGTTPVTPISGQSASTAPSSGSDDLRRQAYTEYDSEDDLKREDINFGPDGECAAGRCRRTG